MASLILKALFLAATVTPSLAQTALLASGTECVQLIEHSLSDITAGEVTSANQKLDVLQAYSKQFTKKAEELSKSTEKKAEESKQKVEQIQRDISSNHIKEQNSVNQIRELELQLKNHKAKLEKSQQSLANAKQFVNSAENRISRAKKKENSRRVGGSAIGAILGTILIPVPILGTVIGGGTGALIGEGINELEDDLKKAKQKLSDAENQYRNVQRDIKSIESSISQCEKDKELIFIRKNDLYTARSQQERREKQFKEEMLFYHRASQYWKEVIQACEHGTDRTTLLQNLLKKAKEHITLDFLKNRGNKRVTMTFIEAWEEIVEHVERPKFCQFQDC